MVPGHKGGVAQLQAMRPSPAAAARLGTSNGSHNGRSACSASSRSFHAGEDTTRAVNVKLCRSQTVVSQPRAGVSLELAVRSDEQVAQGAAQQVGDPPLCQMMRAIVEQVAALTEAAQVA